MRKDIWRTDPQDFFNRIRNESMLYEIDESCLTVTSTKDKNSIE